MFDAGDFPANAVIYIPFDSFAASTGAPSAVSNFAASDIQIYKDGSTTQRSSASGITVTTSFDGNTGLQMIAIDSSDNADAGFYAAGHAYQVAVADITVDGQTLRFWSAVFSIEQSGGAIAEWKVFASVIQDIYNFANTAQLDTTNIKTRIPAALTSGGNIKAGVQGFLDSVFTEGAAGRVAAAFKQFFNIAAPAATMDHGVLVDTVTTVGSVTGAVGSVTAGVTLAGSAVQAIWDALTTALTTVGSIGKRLADDIDATISSRTKPADTQARVTLVDTTTALTNAAPDSAGVTTLLARVGAFTGSGVNTILGFLKAGLSKAATTPSDVGGTFDPSTDANEALRDRGDAAWADSGTPPTAAVIASQVRTELTTELGRVDAAVSSRATQVNVAAEIAAAALATAANLATAKTAIDAIKGKTDNLPSDPADASDVAAAVAAIQSDTDNIQTRLPASLVGGRMDASVGAMAAGVVTAAAIATDAIDADALAADAVLEMQAGLATAATLALVKAKTDNLPVAPAAVGDIPTTAQIADRVLLRSLATGADGGRTVRDALRFNRNRFEIVGGVLTVYEEDDVTIAWTSVMTQTPGDPISASDPA